MGRPFARRSSAARHSSAPQLLAACLLTLCFTAACGTPALPPVTGGGSTEAGLPTTVSSSPRTDVGSQGTDAGSRGTSVTDITQPPPDSPNLPIYKALGWDNVYVLYWLQMQDGWAYVHGIPFTSSEGPTIDTRALLRQAQAGQWQVLENSTNEGLLTDVGQVAEDQGIPDQFKSKHPEAPAGIFPEVDAEDISIMDAVRAHLDNPAYRFNVFLLNKDQGWAYTEVRALTYQAGHIVESVEERVLLRQIDGAWTVQQMESIMGTSQSDFAAGLKARYSDIPAGVLP